MCTAGGRRRPSWGRQRNPGENLLTTEIALDLRIYWAQTDLRPGGTPQRRNRDGVDGFGRRGILGECEAAERTRNGSGLRASRDARDRGTAAGSQLLRGGEGEAGVA